MSQMFTHCGYCGSRFYLAGPCNHVPKMLGWPTCSSCFDRFEVFPKLPEVLQAMKGFRKRWVKEHTDWIRELGLKYGRICPDDPYQKSDLNDLVWDLSHGFDVDLRLENELDRRLNKDRDQEIYRRLRCKYRGEGLVLDGVKVILRDLNYENVSMVSSVMSYWGGSADSRRWLEERIAGKYFVVRYNRKVIGYVAKRGDHWTVTTDLDIVWWAWTKCDTRDDAVCVLLATVGLISLEGNEENPDAIWKKEVKARQATS